MCLIILPNPIQICIYVCCHGYPMYIFCVLQKDERRQQHATKETEFLRLKRSRLGADDFDPIKVIGRGAFGEVSQSQLT
jgi:hypothetical protein